MSRCRYFDGRSSRPVEASVDVVDGQLAIVADGFTRREAPSDLDFAPARGSAPARIAFSDGAVCEIPDANAAASLSSALGWHADLGDRLAARRSTLAAVVVAFVAVSIALYAWGVPLIADAIVDRTSLEWQRSLGEHVLAQLEQRRVFMPSTLPRQRIDALQARVSRLKVDGASRPVVVRFRAMQNPNAFASPGEAIVVSDELVTLAPDDDAILTVIGHEIAHVAHRDAMRGVVRATLLSALAAWYIGDVSTVAAALTGSIAGFRFSRDAEHAADLFAIDLMRKNGISTRSTGELFRRMEAHAVDAAHDGGKAGDRRERSSSEDGRRRTLAVPTYLATHPATDDRIRLFEAASE